MGLFVSKLKNNEVYEDDCSHSVLVKREGGRGKCGEGDGGKVYVDNGYVGMEWEVRVASGRCVGVEWEVRVESRGVEWEVRVESGRCVGVEWEVRVESGRWRYYSLRLDGI